MLPVLWRAKARASLVQIIGYIADRNPIAAQRLKDAIEQAVPTCRNTRTYTVPG